MLRMLVPTSRIRHAILLEVIITLSGESVSCHTLSVFNYFVLQITRHNDPEVRLSSLGSLSGFSSARGLAQLYRDALLIDDKTYQPLISMETWKQMTISKPLHGAMGSAMSFGLLTNYSISLAGQVRQTPKVSQLTL